MKKFNIGWGLTNLCNMRCQFCYSKGTRDEIFISYVRSNYPEIKQSLTTNGYIYEKISKNPVFYDIYRDCIDEVDVSIDFYDSRKHGVFRGQDRAYDWAINTLKISKEMNKLCTIVFVGCEETLERSNLDGLFRIAKENDAMLRMNIYRPVSKNPEINQRFILSYQTLINTLDYINEKYEIVSLSDVLLGTVFGGQKDLKENTGISSIRILPDGAICPSTYLISENFRNTYNIKQGKILDKLSFTEFIKPIVPRECLGCRYEQTCGGGVFDRRILWYETLAQRDPYCPVRLGKELPDKYYTITKTKRISVHDDYLPTLFFKNKD